jgi:hypothetical protein
MERSNAYETDITDISYAALDNRARVCWITQTQVFDSSIGISLDVRIDKVSEVMISGNTDELRVLGPLLHQRPSFIHIDAA